MEAGIATALAKRAILVRPDPVEGGYEVTVVPPFDGVGHDKRFLTYREARGYGGGLRLVLGLKLVDRCDGVAQ